jgi:hypothetical protein
VVPRAKTAAERASTGPVMTVARRFNFNSLVALAEPWNLFHGGAASPAPFRSC